jgi:hypothetical protein
MCAFWEKIFSRGNRDIEIAKSGENYYSILRVGGEVVMAIVQPPTTFDGKTSVGGEVSVFDASGNLQASRSKVAQYGEPIVLFNRANKAGLQPLETITEVKNLLPQALSSRPDFKIEVDRVNENKTVSVQQHERVAIGTSQVLQLNENETISIIRSPKLNEDDREILSSILHFVVVSLIGQEQIYRSNIMLLDPSDNKLKIGARYNMDGYLDRNITLPAGAGGAGVALQTGQVQRIDINIQPHSYFKVDSTLVWAGMKSLFSIPINDNDGNRLGVLSIDSDKPLYNTRLYNDANFETATWLAAGSIGKILEKRM